MPTRDRLSFQPSVEMLEDRRVMTGQLTASLDGSVLRIEGSPNDDTIVVYQAHHRISIEHTPIQVTGRGRRNSVSSTAVSQIIIHSREGNDRITLDVGEGSGRRGLTKPATVWASAGDDVVQGGQGNDFLDGGAGHDELRGGRGNDTLRGYTGNDQLGGEDGNDRLEGSTGNDQLHGGEGDDSLDGGEGNNGLSGEAGNDTLASQSLTDTIDGGPDRDMARLSGAAAGRSASTLDGIEVLETPPVRQRAASSGPGLSLTLPVGAASPALAAQEQRLLDLTNAYRVEQGLPVLIVDSRLTQAARYQANYMARTGHYDHVDLDGRTLVDRVTTTGYRFSFVAENIHLYDPAIRRTRGIDREYRSTELADYFFDGWEVSPPHNENLLSTSAVHIGVALAQDSRGRVYADMVFGRP